MNDKAPRAVGKMTRKEAEIKIDLYKEIFSVVQLVVSSDSYGFETQKCDKCCEGSREENAEDIKPGRVIFCKKRSKSFILTHFCHFGDFFAKNL